MTASAPIQGVYAALPTPFDEKRAIDPKALDHLVDYLAERKIAGLALLTEAAEDALLSAEERRTIIKTVTARLKNKRGWLVSVSTPASYEAVELAKFAESKGALAVILTAPRIPGIGYRELYRHLDRVARGVAIPVLLTSRPGNAIDALLPEELEALIGHASLKGIVAPHALPSVIETWAKRFKGRNATILAGTSLAGRGSMKAGATGFVCGLATIAPELAAELWSALKMDARQTVDRLENQAAPVVEALGPQLTGETKDGVAKLATKIARRSLDSTSHPPTYPFAMMKETLKMQGHPVRPDVRAPYESPRPDAIERLRAVLSQGGVLP